MHSSLQPAIVPEGPRPGYMRHAQRAFVVVIGLSLGDGYLLLLREEQKQQGVLWGANYFGLMLGGTP